MIREGYTQTGEAVVAGAPEANHSSIAVRAARSTLWSLVGQVYQVILGMASFALLSHWLTPGDYGMLGMAATVSGFLGVVGDSGITAAVTRLPEIDRSVEATAFWLALGGAAILTGVAAIAAPLLALFYKNQSITAVSLTLAATFLVAAPMRVSYAKLSRLLRFRALTIIGIVSNTVAVAVAGILAYHRFGVWALVAQTTVVFVLQSVLIVMACPINISPRSWSRSRSRELTRAGSQLSGFSLAITVGRGLDTVLTGRFIGSAGLGLMGMSTKLAYQPVERICGAIYSVFLPTMTELAEPARQSRAFQSATRLLMMIVAPFCLGVVAVAPEIVAWLPARWSMLAPVLRFYAATSLFQPIGYLSMSVLVAHGRAGALLRTSLALIPISWGAAILGALSRSVMGMVAAWSFATIVGGLILLALVRSSFVLGSRFFAAATVPVGVSILMALGVRVVLTLLKMDGTRTGMVIGSLAGTLIYGLGAWLVMRPDLTRAARLLRDAMARRTGRVVEL
jgi:O-antigen/teichoic acid export membrane protein